MYKVFLVEDEIVVREGIRNSIPWDKTPYILTGEAPDGEMALPVITDIKPDILITDIKMPFMDGLALSRIVKKTLPWIKIIILSGHDEFQYAREAISIGVEEYLLKPVSSKDMLNTLEKIAARIEEEKKELLNIEHLKQSIEESVYSISRAIRNDAERSAERKTAVGMGLTEEQADNQTERLLNINGDILWTKFRYASKKDIDSVIQEYTRPLMDLPGENEMLEYYILGEIVVAASKIIEEFNGDIKKVVPLSFERDEIKKIISSKEEFYKKIRELFGAVIEFRDSRTGGRYQSVILKAKEYIDRKYASGDMSLSTVASYVGISPNHLSAVFSQEVGETFIEYLTKVRIEKAKHLLKNTAMKSADIANETGFNDPHYFSFIFKKNTGVSPREFRGSEAGDL